MENVTLLTVISRRWPLILAITLLVFSASLVTYRLRPKGVAAISSITVTPQHEYAGNSNLILQPDASRDIQLEVATTSGWFKDPAYTQDIMKEAGVAAPDSSLRGLAKIFSVTMDDPNSATYQVQYSAADSQQASKIATALHTVIQAGADRYNATQTEGLTIGLNFANPVITSQASSIPLVPVAGLLSGLIIALAAAVLVDRRK